METEPTDIKGEIDGKFYFMSDCEFRMPSYRRPEDRDPIENTLYEEVMRVMNKEVQDHVDRLWDERLFGANSLDTHIFDFIRIHESEDDLDDRFLMMLYTPETINTDPDDHTYVYPMGFTEDDIYKDFRQYLEERKRPPTNWHQVAVRIGPGGGNFYDRYFSCCIEVTDREDREGIESLVQQANKLGLRPDIIIDTAENMAEILARVENDPSLDFDYRDDR